MPPMLYSVAALGACHVPDAETQRCLNRQLSALRARQSRPFAELVREYGECARRAREAEVRAGQLDKEAAELRDEVSSLALRCAVAGGGGTATTGEQTGGGGGGGGNAPHSSTHSNSAVAARALAARAEAYRADLQRARAELSAAYRDRAEQLERAEEARARERRERQGAAEAAESLSLAREEAAGLRARLLETARELDGERAARDLAVREARARADDRDRALTKAEALAADNADLVARLVELRAAEGERLEAISRLHEEALDARRRVQVDAAADRQLMGMLRRGVAGAAGAAGSVLLGAAAAVAAGGAGQGGSRRGSRPQSADGAAAGAGAGAAAASASTTSAALNNDQAQPAYYSSLKEKMGLPEAPARPHANAPERRLPRAPAAVGSAAAAHPGGLVALAWEPPPLTPAGHHHHHPHPHGQQQQQHQHALGSGGRHLATGGADRTVRIWDARAALAAAAAAAASAAASSSADGGGGAAGASSSFRRPPPPPPAPLSPAATFAGGAIMGAVTDACYSCDGRRLVGGMGDARLLVWESATGQLRHALTGHSAAVVAARCYPLDPGWCASAGEDRALKSWDLARGTCARSVACGRTPNAMALAADGSGALITGHVDGSLCVWDFRQGGNRPALSSSSSSSSSPVGEAKDHPGTILCVAPVGPVAGDGGGGGGAGGGGRTAFLGEGRQQLPAGDAVAAAYGASGASAVLTVCRDNAARVWDYRRMSTVLVLRAGGGGGGFGGGGAGLGGMGGGGAFCVGSMGGMGRGRCRSSVSPDGRFVAVGGADGGVYVWDMAAVGRAAAAGGGGGEASAAGGCVSARASAPAAATVLRHHRDAVVAAAWSADGEVLATGDRAGQLALWRMETESAVGGAGGGGRRESAS